MPRTHVVALAVMLVTGAPAHVAAQAHWSVDATPMLEINGSDANGGEVFGGATWATRLHDGSVVIADGPSSSLRWFDARGVPVATAGRAGRGPGDFRLLTWVGHCGADSVYAWDVGLARMSVFSARGKLGRVISAPPTGRVQVLSSCNDEGRFAVAARARRLPAASPPNPRADYFILENVARLHIVDATGTDTASTPETLYMEVLGGMRGRDAGLPRPLGKSSSFALGRDRLFVGIPDSSDIAVFSRRGARVGTIPVHVPARRPTRDQYEEATDALLTSVPAQAREQVRAWVLAIPMPETLPPFSALFAGPEGGVWAQLSMPGDAETRLRALSPDGRTRADISIPQSLAVFEVGVDYVLGLHEDENGEQHVLVYRLRRAG